LKPETLESLVRRDALTPERALAVGAQVATLHGKAKRRPEGTDYRELVDRNFETLLPQIANLIPPRERLALQRFAAAFLIGWATVLEARARSGKVIESRGDLRPENVVFEAADVSIAGSPVTDALRVVDVADELGSLTTELAEITGNRDAGDAVLAGYRSAGGSAQPEALMAFFGAYRAQVRANLAMLASGTRASPDPERAFAGRLLDRSRRLGWQARGPLLLLVGGPSVTKRSALAAALGRDSGLPVLSFNATAGGDLAELARRGGREGGAIFDATSNGSHPQETLAGRPPHGTTAPVIVAMRGTSRDAHLAVDTRGMVSMQVDEVASWLDSLMAAGRGA
jgi:uncharacterized protein